MSFDDTAFQVVSGGVQGISFTDIQDESDDADPTVDATNAVVEIPAGTWDISLEFYGNQEPNTVFFSAFIRFRVVLMMLRNLPVIITQQQFFGTADSDIDAVYRVEEHDLVLDQAEKFYLQLGNLVALTTNRIAGYIRIEKVR